MLAQQPKTPEIPAALITKTFKAQAQLADARLSATQAEQAVQAKTQAMQQVLAELAAACGPAHQPQLDAAGDPVCVAKPAAKPEPKK